MQLVINRFFDTPLIRVAWVADGDLAAQAIALADTHTANVTGAKRHRWDVQVEELVPSANGYVPGAFWVVIVARVPTTLTLEDPRGPMIDMHAPRLGFRPPDGRPADNERVVVTLAAGEAAMMPGWLRHGVQQHAARISLNAVAIA